MRVGRTFGPRRACEPAAHASLPHMRAGRTCGLRCTCGLRPVRGCKARWERAQAQPAGRARRSAASGKEAAPHEIPVEIPHPGAAQSAGKGGYIADPVVQLRTELA